MITKIIKIMPTKILISLWKKKYFPKWFRELVIWKTNSRFLVAVLGIIRNEKNQILLLKHTYREQPWGIPSGWIEYEQPFNALEREVFEETAFLIEAKKVLSVRHVEKPHRIDLIIEGIFIEGTFKASPEVSDYGFFDFGDWPEGMPKEQQLLITTSLDNQTNDSN